MATAKPYLPSFVASAAICSKSSNVQPISGVEAPVASSMSWL
jgi:hypothetical protein